MAGRASKAIISELFALSLLGWTLALWAGETIEPPLGSSEFQPSPERPFGWRGDGSGRFPGANPPIHWGRAAKSVKTMRIQANKPKDGDTGTPASDGIIRQWLALGPVDEAAEQALLKPAADGKIDCWPSENDKAGKLAWKKAETDGTLDLGQILGPGKLKDVGYAHAYIFAEAKAHFRLGLMGADKIYLNGTALKGGDFDLEKGWNRLLLRLISGRGGAGGPMDPNPNCWYARMAIYGISGESETTNVVWTTKMPGWSISSPVMAGDKLFVLGDMRTLCCVNANNGKILWARTATLWDAATEEDKKANPDATKEIEGLVARLGELDQLIVKTVPLTDSIIGEKHGIEAKIDNLAYQVDKKKFNIKVTTAGEPGHAPRTPVTDGRRVYANYHPCLTVCYDINGERKWVHNHDVTEMPGTEHGVTCSPCLAAGKLVVHVSRTIALDAGTGKVSWQLPAEHKHDPAEKDFVGNGSLYDDDASLISCTINKEAVLLTPVYAVRVRDGKYLGRLAAGWGCIPTPVVNQNMWYRLHTRIDRDGWGLGLTWFDFIKLPEKTEPPFKPDAPVSIIIDTSKFPHEILCEENIASPLYHDGLAYIVNGYGILSVLDAEKHEAVYQELLDIDNLPGGPARGVCGASPALAGKYIYCFGNHGTCQVLEAGRKFKPVGRNHIDFFTGGEDTVAWQAAYGQQEQTVSCPVFQGKRMYYRGIVNLYCIEENLK